MDIHLKELREGWSETLWNENFLFAHFKGLEFRLDGLFSILNFCTLLLTTVCVEKLFIGLVMQKSKIMKNCCSQFWNRSME